MKCKMRRKPGKIVTRSIAMIMAIVLVLTSVDITAFAAGAMEQESSVFVNGHSATIPAEGFDKVEAAIDYKTEISCSLQNDASALFLYLAEEDRVETKDISEQNWTAFTDETILKPGNYYLAYNTTDFNGMDYKAGFRVIPVNLNTPSDIDWDGTKATWKGITQSANNKDLDSDVKVTYTVTLYKDGEKTKTIGSIESTEYDLKDIITEKGYGDYTYTVRAVATNGTDRYSNSPESEKSTEYAFRDTQNPVITSFSVGEAETEKNCLVAEATDNSGIDSYAFVASSTAPAADSSVWKPVASCLEGNSYRLVSGELEASGYYYLYVRDEAGNVTCSADSIAVTRVLCYATMTEDGLDTQTASDSLYLFGTDSSTTLQKATATGYTFLGWYAHKDASGEAVSAVTTGADGEKTQISAGVDYKVYAKFEAQNYTIALTASDDTKTYEGTGDGKGITLTAKLAQVDYDSIAYKWYFRANETAEWKELGSGTQGSDAFTSSYTIDQVAETGSYKAEAVITLGGKKGTASAEKAVSITKATLTLKLSDATITYGDAAPSEYEATVVSGLVGGETYENLVQSGALTLGTFETTYDPTKEEKAGAGPYEIMQSPYNMTKADNYIVTVEQGTLTVSQKNVEKTGVTLTYKVKKTAQNQDQYADAKSDEDWYYLDAYKESYTGSEIKPLVAAWDGETQIPEANYEVEYSSNVNASKEAVVSLKFKGNYTGTLSKKFTITKQKYDSAVQMKDSGEVVYDESAAWTYGETALTPFVTENRSGGAVTFYYAAKTSEESRELDRDTAVTTMPTDAGTYCVWAVIEGNANYEEAVTPAYTFTIRKREITLTAVSYADGDGDTVHNAWIYDGLAHAANDYTQDGDFVGTDAFRSVTVSGTITDCGEVDNVISYELTPSTNKDNYTITTVNGKLQVKQLALPVPNGFGWSKDTPGTLTFTPVSRKNLTVEYRICLYRYGEAQSFKEMITADSTVDVSAVIKEDATNHSNGTYYASIQTLPKGGTALANYAQSGTTVCENTYIAKIHIQKDNRTIAKVLAGDEEVETLYALPGESVNLTAGCNTGYHNITWAPGVVTPGDAVTGDYITISGSKDTTKKVTVPSSVSAASEINLVVTAQDESPVITVFQGENAADAQSVTFTMKAQDAIGINGYALVTSEDGTIDTNTLTFQPMTEETSGTYTAT
ncbi:MAG: MBG domain-containing protein, partial [Lachnospiraceae bacterium]|nr:MBG domain-containing protein [Lachnospiraceae bacterium]